LLTAICRRSDFDRAFARTASPAGHLIPADA
jgi:hypothetical protein